MKLLNQKSGKLFASSMAVAALFAMGSTAQATSITGSISFTGSANFTNGATIGTGTNENNSLGAATQVDFTPGNQYVGPGTQTGIYTAIPGLTPASFTSFLFTTAPITPLWSVTYGGIAYSFNLGSTPLTESYNSSTGVLGLAGVGTLFAVGGTPSTSYTPTAGTFNFSSQNGNPAAQISFSASSAVPIPAALFFVAPALAGVFGFSRRKNGAGLTA